MYRKCHRSALTAARRAGESCCDAGTEIQIYHVYLAGVGRATGLIQHRAGNHSAWRWGRAEVHLNLCFHYVT